MRAIFLRLAHPLFLQLLLRLVPQPFDLFESALLFVAHARLVALSLFQIFFALLVFSLRSFQEHHILSESLASRGTFHLALFCCALLLLSLQHLCLDLGKRSTPL